jgi:hypothetical protein
MSLERDIAGLLADRNDDWISPYEFDCAVACLVDRKRRRREKLSIFGFFYGVYVLLTHWIFFVGPFLAFHFLLVPLTPLGKAPEVFGWGTTVWYFAVLPVSLLFSFVVGLLLTVYLDDLKKELKKAQKRLERFEQRLNDPKH